MPRRRSSGVRGRLTLWKTFFQILWTNICRTLVGELRRMRQGAAPILQGESARVAVSLDKIVAAMSVLSRTSQLMGEWTSPAYWFPH